MKVYTTILAVTGITVQQGSTNSAGKPIRDVVITTADGDVVLRLMAENREDLQVTFAGGEQGSWKATLKKQLAGERVDSPGETRGSQMLIVWYSVYME